MSNCLSKLLIICPLLFVSSASVAQKNKDRNTQAISQKTSVVFAENFQSYKNKSQWRDISDTEIVEACGESRDRCLRVSYRPNYRGSPVLQTKVAIPPGTHYRLSYDIYFEPGFEFVKGGKLPGLSPINYLTGCREERPDGWSARIMWKRNAKVMAYYYSQNRKNRCGDGEVSHTAVFKEGVWQAIELELKLNTSAIARDALIRVSVDGKVVSESKGLRFRASMNEASQISQLLFSTFYGGNDRSWSPSKTTHIRLDNFIIEDLGAE